MNESDIIIQSSSIGNIWRKIPIWLKAIVVGFVVNTIGIGTWILLITTVPAPWSLVLMALFLVAYVKYFGGRWGRSPSSALRKERFRAIGLSKGVWFWGLIGALMFILITQSGFVLTFRFMTFPAEQFKAAYNFDAMPLGMAWIGLIMASIVAGICEETGFRGYMQQPLEKKYGVHTAIIITSIVFVIVHLHQAWAPPVLIHIFIASALVGILAAKTGSIIPGIIGHTLLDIINFSYWWSDIAGEFKHQPLSVTGMDTHFLIWCLIFLIGVAVFVYVMNNLTRLQKESD